MKLIDEKGRIFGKISLIDIIVVALAAVLALGLYARFFVNEKTALVMAGDKFTYEIKISSVRTFTADALQVGDKLWEKDNDTYIGTITDVRREPATQVMKLLDGSYEVVPAENRYDVYLTVEGEGLVSNGRYYASRTFEISQNAVVNIYSKYCATGSVIWQIY